jgi:hypothetical protein
MSTWYRLHTYQLKIEPVEIVRETKEQVVILDQFYRKERRHFKGGEYFPTFEDAKAAAIKRSSDQVDRLENSLHHAKTELGMAKALKLT